MNKENKEGSMPMENVLKPNGEKRCRIFKEYTEFPGDLSIEQIKEVMKADTAMKVWAYNCCYLVIIGKKETEFTE